MRIIRSNNEQVVAAQSNNTYYNQYNTAKEFEYDSASEFSYSDKKFMNELARDNVYGTSNIRPVKHDRSTVSRRMYKEAIEEASRVKTYGYYNEFDKVMDEFVLHESRPGKLKNQMSNDVGFNTFHNQVNNNRLKKESKPLTSFHNSFTNEKEDNVIQFEEIKSKKQEAQDFSFEKNKEFNANFENNKVFNVNFENNKEFNNGFEKNNQFNNNFKFDKVIDDKPLDMGTIPKDMPNNTPNDSNNNISNIQHKPDKYEDIMNKVSADLKHEIATRVVDEDKVNLRKETKVEVNNIPYKKTKMFEKILYDKGNTNEEPQLQVRDCKANKQEEKNAKEQFDKVGAFIWLSSIIVMIFPVLGFIVSSIVSLVVPKDKIYKIFVRFCLMAHILCSIAVAYLYYNDMINLSIIKSYIGNFNIL